MWSSWTTTPQRNRNLAVVDIVAIAISSVDPIGRERERKNEINGKGSLKEEEYKKKNVVATVFLS